MRFSVGSLFTLTILVAMFLVICFQFCQQSEIAKLRRQFDDLERYSKIQSRINTLLLSLDMNDESDIDLLRLVRGALPIYPSPLPAGEFEWPEELRESKHQLVDVDGSPGGLAILSLSHNPNYNPATGYSVNVLFDDQAVVDVIIRKKDTRIEQHDIDIVDYNDDNILDLVLNCRTMLSDPSLVLRYQATEGGFVLESMPETAE